jgi:predicted nucleotidyltransferase
MRMVRWIFCEGQVTSLDLDRLREHWARIDDFDDRAAPVLNGLVNFIHYEGKERGDFYDLITIGLILISCQELVEKYLDGQEVDDTEPWPKPQRLPIDWRRFAHLIQVH